MSAKRVLVSLLAASILVAACGGDDAASAPMSCPAGATDCSGVCRDLSSDFANCGGCGVSCAAGQVCNASACSTSCSAPRVDCSGSCVDTGSDRANCGGCGVACGAVEICSGGSCKAVCNVGEAICGGSCAVIATDPANCGGCGNACAGAQTCEGGRCVAPTCGTGTRLSEDGSECVACSQSAVLNDAPVGYWRLDEASLTDPAKDSAPAPTAGIDGAYVGVDPDVTLGTTTTAADGNKGMTMATKTVASGVVITNYTNMPTTEVSVELWVKMDVTDEPAALFSYASPDHSNAFLLYKEPRGASNNLLRIYVGATSIITPLRVDDGTWKMLVATWSENTKLLNLYVNGDKVGEWSLDGLAYTPLSTGGRIYFGQEQDSLPADAAALDATQAFVGDMDDVAIFDKVLTDAQVKAHYHGYRCN